MTMVDVSRLDPHLDGLRRGELHVAHCARCGSPAFPPPVICARCGAVAATEWFVASGHGTIWSFAVFRRTYLATHPAPYTVAVVELAEGPKLISNIVGAQPATIRVGLPVRAEIETGFDGAPPRVLFRPEPLQGGAQ
jgi:uncharacterized OB-fold protein